VPKAKRGFPFITLAIVATFAVPLLAVILHPFLFAIPSRIAEFKFQRHVRVGMSESDVLALARRSGNDGSNGGIAISYGQVDIFFAHYATVCVAGGTEYVLRFDAADRLQSWRTTPFNSAC
jgi:hypothetical protein